MEKIYLQHIVIIAYETQNEQPREFADVIDLRDFGRVPDVVQTETADETVITPVLGTFLDGERDTGKVTNWPIVEI